MYFMRIPQKSILLLRFYFRFTFTLHVITYEIAVLLYYSYILLECVYKL